MEEHASTLEREREKEKGRMHVEERERKREKEKECMHSGERESVLWLLLFYVFSSPWACPMQIGLARSAVCST